MSSMPEITTPEIMNVILDSIHSSGIVPADQVNLESVSDPVWEGTDEVSLFHLDQKPIQDQNEVIGYEHEIRVDVISITVEQALQTLGLVCEVIEDIQDNVFIRENHAVGKEIAGRKIDNAFIAARNYTVYTKG